MRWSTILPRLRLAALVLGTFGIMAAIGWLWFSHWAPSKHDYRFQGVDVSEVEGPIDWVAVKEGGADFAYIRATRGATGRDARFDENWQATRQAGLRHGAYLDFSLCQLASDQADNFNTVVPRTDDALPPAVHVDFSPDCSARPDPRVVVAEVARAMATLENHMGKPALLKVSRTVDRQYGLTAAIPRTIWATGNLFPPEYSARPWRMWQANDRRRVAGADQPLHWDVVRK